MELYPNVCYNNPSIHRFSVGDINGVVIHDGKIVLDDNLWSVPEEAVIRTLDFAHQSTSSFEISINIVVLDTPKGRVLIDSGSRAYVDQPSRENTGLLLPNMIAAGISPESIDSILITHGHSDHFGGLTDENGTKTFPNAKVYINREEHLLFSSNETIELPSPFASDFISE